MRERGRKEVYFRIVADAVDLTVGIEGDERASVDEFGIFVDEAVSQGHGCEQAESFGIFAAHDVGDLDRIDERRESS